jgi:hypothetical protein
MILDLPIGKPYAQYSAFYRSLESFDICLCPGRAHDLGFYPAKVENGLIAGLPDYGR